MNWTKISIDQFKCFNKLSLDLFPGVNCFVGNNGMGKTNILDAIYYLSMTKSNFQRQDKDVIKHNNTWFRLSGHVQKGEYSHNIAVKFRIGEKKAIEFDNKKYKKLSLHIGKIPVVLIAPDDIQDLLDGSLDRRKFMDQSISQLNRQYLLNLALYNKILLQKNSLLKNNKLSLSQIEPILDAYDRQMMSPAEIIFKHRRAFVQEFQPFFNNYYRLISNGNEGVEVKYKSSLENQEWTEIQKNSRFKDFTSRRVNNGVHKDDLEMRMNDLPLRTFASQGQKKSFVLSMRLAQFEYLSSRTESKPILLLDDIFDKLDRSRVESLLQIISKKPFGQVFITDTHISRVPDLLSKWKIDHKLLTVENGNILNASEQISYEEEE